MSLAKSIATIASKYEWDQLTDAYGYCFWVPRKLQQLTSPNRADRSRALSHLYEMLHHQQTHYEATGHLVATLIRLATLPEIPAREKLISMAAEMMYLDTQMSDDTPVVVGSEPFSWCFHWPSNFEESSVVLFDVLPELWTLTAERSGLVSYWAAKLIEHVHDHRPGIPVSNRPEPTVLSDGERELLKSILSGEQYPLCEFDDIDVPVSEVTEMLNKVTGLSFEENVERKELVDVLGVEFPDRLPELSADELSLFSHKLSWDSAWQANEEFVSRLLTVVEADEGGDGIGGVLLSGLSQVQVCLRRAADLLLRYALDAEDPSIQQSAAHELYQLPWSSQDRVGYLINTLRDGAFPAQAGLLDAIWRGASNMRWLVRATSSDPNEGQNAQAWQVDAQQMLVDGIVGLLHSDDARLRSSALIALGGMSEVLSEHDRSVVRSLVGDPAADVRSQVASFLDSEDAADIPLLARLLADAEEQVRSGAARELPYPNRNRPELTELSLAALNDLSPRVVSAVANQWSLRNKGAAPDCFETEELAELLLNSQTAETRIDNLILQAVLIEYLDKSKRETVIERVRQRLDEVPYWLSETVRRRFKLG